MKPGWGRRITHLALWLPVAAYALVVSRGFFLYADRAITLSTDDGLANIAYVLATEGRYGFLSSPVLLDLPRDEGLFSYGPFYFYTAAALVWLFGYSLTIVRAVHLGVILAAVVASRVWFGRAAGGAIGAIVAVGLLVAFERGQWPMVRPDSMVSLFAVLMVMAAGMAIRTSLVRYWAAAGFAAACGALTHLVAWSLVPAMVVILLVSLIASARLDAGGWRRPTGAWSALMGAAAGGLVGALLFYASFGFRVRDQIQFLMGYQEYTGSMTGLAETGPSFSDLMFEHFRLAYWYLPYPLEYVVWATLWTGLAAVLVFVWGRAPQSREHLAMVAPPLVVWTTYLLSLGTYNNFHSGYTILNQVMWLWTLGALGAVTLKLAAPWPRVHRALSASAFTLALFLGVGVLTFMTQRTAYRALAAGSAVSIDEYTGRVLEALPAGARAWGGVAFGIEHPGRIQLVQYDDAVTVLQSLDPAKRESVSPDYIVWSYSENRDTALSALGGEGGALRALTYLLPDVRYQLVSMTAGAPYGVTRVYARAVPGLEGASPTVSVYDPRFARWTRATAPPVALDLTPAPAAGTLTVGYDGSGATYAAVQSVLGELEAGTYLLRVTLTDELPGDFHGLWLASPTRETQDTFGEFGPDFDITPRLDDEPAVHLVYRHPGGPVYVSQFGVPPGAIAGVTASRLLPLPNYSALRREDPEEQPLPAAGWVHPDTLVGPDWPEQPNVRLSSLPDDEVLVEGNAIQFGYQAYGPQIPVEPFQRMRIRFSVRVMSGTACLGILDGTGMAWLVVPERLQPVYEFQVNDSQTVKPVLANCSPSPEGIVPIRAVIGPGAYAAWSDREPPYVDLLMRLYREGPALGPGGTAGSWRTK